MQEVLLLRWKRWIDWNWRT